MHSNLTTRIHSNPVTRTHFSLTIRVHSNLASALNPGRIKLPLVCLAVLCLALISTATLGQGKSALSSGNKPVLTVEKIMQDPKWIGYSPSDISWSMDGKTLFFYWNPEQALHDSLYYIKSPDQTPRKATNEQRQNSTISDQVVYNQAQTAYTFTRNGDIYLGDVRSGKERRITHWVETAGNPIFSFQDTRIVYTFHTNLYSWDITTGATEQLTNFQEGSKEEEKKPSMNAQDKWLQQDQLEQFDVLRTRKYKRDQADSMRRKEESYSARKTLRSIYLEDKELQNTNISPDGRYITFLLLKRPVGVKRTFVPDYVTESGYTRDLPARTKVGAPQGNYSFFLYDTGKDTVLEVLTNQIPGISDQPDYMKDYPQQAETGKSGVKDSASHKPAPRPVIINGPYWSDNGGRALVDIRSQDNKDRWLMLLDPASGKLQLIDRQRDEAWIGGPGIGYHFGGGSLGWLDEHTIWYQSEATGYSHLYKQDVISGKKTALTSGQYEVQEASLSRDRKHFYITTNEIEPGQQQFYQLPVNGGKAERITTLTGSSQVKISPDEKQIAFLYSASNKPWELYLQDNKAGSQPRQITFGAMSESFRAYPWRAPEVITFPARDGTKVYARIYRPSDSASSPHGKPAVIFVHGAGYLQNAHKWWSYYFREYMFHNLLADHGYTVLDIDYRGSAGYGRDWRTGIYRHMGGKDLTDQVDGVKYLCEKEGIDPRHIGIYGGSYGGFITLMAMFTQGDVFAAGAALRSVTDWAHYNHGYTSDILNIPQADSLAYHKSSPIYFADGLKGHLLMCHGMVDENVHFQDIVRLSQRLIELGKDNWELAVYPMEDHSFVEPSSWTDEYKRIFKLFETWVK